MEQTERLCWADVLQEEESAASGLNRGGQRQERPLVSGWHLENEAFMRGLDTVNQKQSDILLISLT